MASEIRANIIKNRVGLGTIEYSNTGPVISGVTTALNFKTGTSNLHNTGLNVQDLDVDGHTNLDNVSIAGVSTFSGVLDATNTPASIRVAQDIQHKGDADTKINFHDADKLRIELGGVTSAFSGLKSTSGATHAKWGINVATPAAALHIDEAYNHQGVLRVTNGNQNTNYYHQLEMSGTNNIFTLWKHYDGTNNYNSHAHGSTGHMWYISGSEKLRVHSNGNVGIGSATPGRPLTITSTEPRIRLQKPNLGHGEIYIDDDNSINLSADSSSSVGSSSIIFRTNGAEKVRIKEDKVGIGTDNPQCILDINKDISGGVNNVDIRNHHPSGGAALRVKTQGTYGSPTYQAILGASDAGGTIRVGAVSNHPLLLLVNNQEKLRIDTSGFIGMGGNTNPTNVLHIKTAVTNTAVATIESTATNSYPFLRLKNDAREYQLTCHGALSDSFTIYDGTAGSHRFFINSDGYVGINETNPRTGLTISKLGDYSVNDGNTYYMPVGKWSSTWNGMNVIQDSTDYWVGFVGGYLKSSSSVNISLAPNRSNTGQQAGMYISGEATGNSSADFTVGKIVGGSATGQGTSGNLRATKDELFRITSTGQLLLGETSAFDSNVAMQFRKDNAGSQSRFIFRNRGNNGSSRVRLIMSTLNRAANADIFSGFEQYQSGGMAIFNGQSDTSHCNISVFAGNWQPITLKNGNVSGGDAMHARAYWGTSNGIQMEVGGPQSGTHKSIRFTTSHYGGERGYIGVTLGGTSYNSSSDYRMKQDVVDLTGAIDRVKSFKPRRFKWKEDPTYTVDGFLAHEASTVVPESVDGEKDAVDSEGDPKYQVMDNSRLVPVLTAALKEAIAKIETLETKVAALEGS